MFKELYLFCISQVELWLGSEVHCGIKKYSSGSSYLVFFVVCFILFTVCMIKFMKVDTIMKLLEIELFKFSSLLVLLDNFVSNSLPFYIHS